MHLTMSPMRPAVRFGTNYPWGETRPEREQRHSQEMAQWLRELNDQFDQIRLERVRQPKEAPPSKNTTYADLIMPSGRRLSATLYFDYKDPKRLACFELSGTSSRVDYSFPHPPGHNLFLQNIRVNNWDANRYVVYRSTLQPSPRVDAGESLWNPSDVDAAQAFAEKMKDRILAQLANTPAS